MLAANLEFLLKNPAEREKMAANAHKTLEEMRGSLKKTLHILDSYFFPLTIKRDLESLNNGTG